MKRPLNIFTAVLVVLAIVAVLLRAFGRNESFWFDEGMTWWLASLPPAEMLRVIRGDVAAPVYFWLMHAWQIPFGTSEHAMRSLSGVAAVLTLVPFYFVARTVLRSRLAIGVACALMAISYMQLQYAHEARYYALMSLLAMTALACLPSLASRRSFGAMVTFVACVGVGLYTHNMMMFCLAGLNVAWLAWPGQRTLRQRIVDVAIANIAILLLYLPWVPTLLQQMKWMTGAFWATRPGAQALGITLSAVSGVDVYAIPGAAWNLFGWHWNTAGVMAVLCACLIIGIREMLVTRESRRHALALIAFGLGPILLVFLYSQLRQPIFIERVFIASSAVMPILLAMVVDTGRDRASRMIGSAIVLIVGLLGICSSVSLWTETRKEDWRGAYATVAAMPESNRRLIAFVANEGELPFAYYATHDSHRTAEPRTGAPSGFLEIDPPKTIRRVTGEADLAHMRSQISSGKWDEIVLVLSHDDFSDPDGLTEQLLRAEWALVDETNLRLVRVLRFKSRARDGG